MHSPAPSGGGSSPRERGTRFVLLRLHLLRRFIPARAGNTNRERYPPQEYSVHPRASGEHHSTRSLAWRTDGSSPRERGTPHRRPSRQRRQRFIPARAGNTSTETSVPEVKPVHPRASGEHPGRRGSSGRFCGSSPRERGTRAALAARRRRLRFIPARAGNTPSPAPSPSGPAVHPRASGEHAVLLVARPVDRGSSPRERGTRGGRTVEAGIHRFIPARAGNTVSRSASLSTPSVHPRASGEHLTQRCRVHYHVGSSPRERGTPSGSDCSWFCERFIPARAGNTRTPSSAPNTRAVHPRASGEHGELSCTTYADFGSSPRERGTRDS